MIKIKFRIWQNFSGVVLFDQESLQTEDTVISRDQLDSVIKIFDNLNSQLYLFHSFVVFTDNLDSFCDMEKE